MGVMMGSVEFDLARHMASEIAHDKFQEECDALICRLQSTTYPVDCTGYDLEEENPFGPYQCAFPHAKFCAASLDCVPTGDAEIIEMIRRWEKRHKANPFESHRYYGIYDIEEYIYDINTQD